MELAAEMLREFVQAEFPLSIEPMTSNPPQKSSAWGQQPKFDAVIAALRTVHDPEIPVNIYDLGLIYRIELIASEHVEIDMTLTAPGCPVAGDILRWVEKAVLEIDGIAKVKVNLVFNPPWDQSKMSEDAKLELGFI